MSKKNEEKAACILLMTMAAFIGLGIRYSLRAAVTPDFSVFLNGWYELIRQTGWHSIGISFSDYAPPYIYLLNIVHTAFPTMGNLDAVKLPSILADCATVLLGTGIVYTATKSWPASSFAFAALMFAPTVFINSAYWGQSDSILAACILACLWCLLHQKPTLAILAFGLAFSFKLQAVFLAPFLLAMVVMGYIPKKSLLGFPIPIFLSYLPAWLAGRPLIHLLSIYPMQTNRYKFLTFNAATAFSWFSKADYDTVAPAGILLAGGICFLYITLAFFRRKPDLEWREGVLLATLSCLIVPFFLPSMHDRYFYLVDVLTILLAFCYPRLFYIPILSQLISLATYHYSLFSSEVLPLPILGLGNLFLIAVLARESVRILFPGDPPAASHQAPPAAGQATP